METVEITIQSAWPLWRKIAFRFFFIFLTLTISPWTWLDSIPGVGYVTQYYYSFMDWAVNAANKHFFHVREVLVPLNGSGDTSYGWAQLWLILSVSFMGCIIWSSVDFKRGNYSSSDYWLRVVVRYYIIIIALSYGIIKLFALQMTFPNLSQLATPLGDFLPMRLSWLFIGYSKPYEIFSGALEVLAALLLLNRKTITFGLIVATAVFLNIMVLNLCYDIPVKIFSMQIVFYCFFLLANDSKRLFRFFILNKGTTEDTSYNFAFSKRWMRITKIIFKSIFVVLILILPFYDTWEMSKEHDNEPVSQIVKQGVYDVTLFVLNKDTIPLSMADTLRWKDVIFDKGDLGSVNCRDTVFRQRYHRGYFIYSVNAAEHKIDIQKNQGDKDLIFSLHYTIIDTNTMFVRTKIRTDSIQMKFVRSNRKFQLTEKQFHWLSESNR